MLLDALDGLLSEKSFEQISIQEIAARATLNRATFYLHYPDKAALLQALTAHRFSKLLERRGIAFRDCDGALQAIALGVCDYLTETVGGAAQLSQLPVETSIVSVIEDMILQGLVHHEPAPASDPALLAATAAWAVFGAAREWFQHPHRVPAEEMARRIETLAVPLFSVRGVRGVEERSGETAPRPKPAAVRRRSPGAKR